MKNLLVLSLFMLSMLTSAQTAITKNLGDFSILKVYNGIELELIKSTEQKIEITGELSEKVKIKSNDETLRISLKFPETLAKNKVKVTLYYAKEIKVIDANEGATVTGKGFDQDQIEVKVQEGAFMNLVINTKHLKVKASSGGIIKLSGKAKNQTVNTDLGGVYHGYNMDATNLTIVKAGSGSKAEINAGESLDLKVTFGGSIFYKGKPKVLKEKKVIGGVIEQRN